MPEEVSQELHTVASGCAINVSCGCILDTCRVSVVPSLTESTEAIDSCPTYPIIMAA